MLVRGRWYLGIQQTAFRTKTLVLYYNLHPTQALRGLVRVKTERIAGR